MANLSKEALLALTPEQWADWFDAQNVELRLEIISAVDRLTTQGYSDRQAMVSVYAIVEHLKSHEVDTLMSVPSTYRM